MADQEPPYLSVGTEVSAKYRGAFCEAKVKKVVRSVKCRVTFKETGNSTVVNDEQIRGTVRTGAMVEVRHPESGQYVEATIVKTTDSSMYTVVFDDGDERTLRRTMLCLKGNKHFIESETLDQLPLTHPEHFGTPVMQKKDKRRSGANYSGDSSELDSSDSESESPSKRRTYCGRLADCIGKVVCATSQDKRKCSWFPALVVLPSAADVPLKTKGHLLVRSFKDNKFSAVLKKETKDFNREVALRKSDDKTLKVAIEKALLYLDNHELPHSWDQTALLGSDNEEVSEEETSDDEPSEEKDRFVAQLFKFMDDRGTPINKAPTIGMKDLNLYRLYKLVKKYGGFNKVTSQMRWRLIYSKMNLPTTNSASTTIMSAYKKYLHAFEHFDRRLGSNIGSSCRPHRSRNMLPFRDRDKDMGRSPRKKLLGKDSPLTPTKSESPCPEPVKTPDSKTETPKKIKLPPMVKATTRSDFKKKNSSPEKVEKEPEKPKIEKKETEKKEVKKKEEKKAIVKIEVKKEIEEKAKTKLKEEAKVSPKFEKKVEKKEVKKEKVEETPPLKGRRGARKSIDVTKEEDSETDPTPDEDNHSDNSSMTSQSGGSMKAKKKAEVYNIGCKLGVRYGRGRTQKIYEAKIVDSNVQGGVTHYRVHYNGWNVRYDEWIKKERIVYRLPDDKQPPVVKASPLPTSPKKTPNPPAEPKPSASPKHSLTPPQPKHVPVPTSERPKVATPPHAAERLKHTPPALPERPKHATPPDVPERPPVTVISASPAKVAEKKVEVKLEKQTEKPGEDVTETEVVKETVEETEVEEVKVKKEIEEETESPVKPPRPTRSNSVEAKPQTTTAKAVTRRSRRLSGHLDESEINARVSEEEEEENENEENENEENDNEEEEKQNEEEKELEEEVKEVSSEEKEFEDPPPDAVSLPEVLPVQTEAVEEEAALVQMETECEDMNLQCTEEFEPNQIEETTVETPVTEEKTSEVEPEPEKSEAMKQEEKSKSVMSNLDAILEAAGHYDDADDEEFFSMYQPTSTEERKRKRKPKKDENKKRAKRKKKEDIVMADTPPTSPDSSSGRGNISPEEEQSTKSEHEANVEVARYMSTPSGATDSPHTDSPKETMKRKADVEKGATPKKIKRTYKSKKQIHGSDSEDYELPAHVQAHTSGGATHSPYRKHGAPSQAGKRSPKLSKYNFYLDDSAEELARDQRISILQSRIAEIRKIYMELKSEVALIDRRRKRARRKEREAEREAAAALLQQTSQLMASQAQVASLS